jgi:hypothetical protein
VRPTEIDERELLEWLCRVFAHVRTAGLGGAEHVHLRLGEVFVALRDVRERHAGRKWRTQAEEPEPFSRAFPPGCPHSVAIVLRVAAVVHRGLALSYLRVIFASVGARENARGVGCSWGQSVRIVARDPALVCSWARALSPARAPAMTLGGDRTWRPHPRDRMCTTRVLRAVRCRRRRGVALGQAPRAGYGAVSCRCGTL